MIHELIEILLANNVPIANAITRAVAQAHEEGFMVDIHSISNHELCTFLKVVTPDLIAEQRKMEEKVKNDLQAK